MRLSLLIASFVLFGAANGFLFGNLFGGGGGGCGCAPPPPPPPCGCAGPPPPPPPPPSYGGSYAVPSYGGGGYVTGK
uniref:Uncharacterized protein n=1 Tax=Steinernema glaseri TaxID=37863 RepID=A0A1I7Z268_9BILA